jgi:hypothetical protein
MEMRLGKMSHKEGRKEGTLDESVQKEMTVIYWGYEINGNS